MVGAGLVGLSGLCGGRLAGASLRVSCAEAIGVALIGGMLVAFKALLHSGACLLDANSVELPAGCADRSRREDTQ